MTHIPDPPQPLDPLGDDDPLLQQVRDALRRGDAQAPVHAAARDDLDRRLRQAGATPSFDSVAHEAGPSPYSRTGSVTAPASAAPRPWFSTRRHSPGMLGRVMSAVTFATVAAGLVFAVVLASRALTPSTTLPLTRVYTTGDGQIARVALRDGSSVTLAPHTTIEVARAFGARRDVTVRGEAYFDVVPGRVPFVVHTGGVTTRVLGTTFDVQRYDADPSTRVLVTSGKVTVGGRRSVTLVAGERGDVTDSTAVKTVTDATSHVDWTSGTMAFREVPASELLDAVGHWYGLEFHVTDSALVRRPVVATLVSGETRADALELISKLLSATMTFTETDRGVTIVTLQPARADRTARPDSRRLRDNLLLQAPEVGR